MVNHTHEEFHYEGYRKCESHCLIDIYRFDTSDRVVVVATEADDNPGTSVTNLAEHIATYVCRKHDIKFEELIWIEHYPPRIEHYPPRKDSALMPEPHGSWDLTWFTIDKAPIANYWHEPKGTEVLIRPRWNHLAVEMKDRLISGDSNDLNLLGRCHYQKEKSL